MIIITGSVTLRDQHGDAAFALGCEHSARSRHEPGCIAHNCYRDAENPGRMCFFEQWEDMEAVQKHFAVPQSGAFIREIAGMAIDKPSIRIFSASELDLPKT